jgi:hypothetical protein
MQTRRPTSQAVLRGIRVTKGVSLGSIFLLLAMPLVAFSTCSGTMAETSGYQALVGAPFPATAFGIQPHQYPDYGPDWWVVGIMLLALVGIGTAWWGGLKGASVGLGVAIAGLVVLQPAIGFFGTPPNTAYWSADPGSGGFLIGLVFVVSAFLDLGWISWRSWWEIRRPQKDPQPDRGDWWALGLGATAFLIPIGAALVVVAIFAIAQGFRS